VFRAAEALSISFNVMQIRLRETLQIWGGRSGQALTLRQNFAWTFVGDMIFAAAQWAMLAVIAKLGTPEMVGLFTFGLAVTAPIIIFANLKLRAVQATDVRQDFQFGNYLALRLVALSLAFAAITIFAWWSAYSLETKIVIMLVAAAKCFDALSDIMYGYFQLHERMNRVSISRVVQGISQLVALGLVLLLTESLIWGLAAWAIASGLVTVGYDIPNVRSVRNDLSSRAAMQDELFSLAPIWQFTRLSKLLWLALPLGFATMLGSLWLNIPRYVIQYYGGTYQLGIFAAVTSLMIIGSTIIAALGQSASPRLAKYHAESKFRAFDQLIIRLVILGGALGLAGLAVMWVAGDLVLTLLYTVEYAAYSGLLIWLFLGMGVQFTFIFLGTGMQAMREFRFFLPVQATSCVLVLALAMLLVPDYGLLGGVLSMIGANIFEGLAFLLLFFLVRNNTRQAVVLKP
jgi:O-antigen/teichoic acid export membrane protein